MPHEPFNDQQTAELGARGLWLPLLRSRLLEEASAGFIVEPEELDVAWASFCKTHGLDANGPVQTPPDLHGCPPDRLRSVVESNLRAARWKEALFGPEAALHFDKRKPALDRVVYSLLRVKDEGVARELWFRLKEGEATFADLAPRFAGGDEVYTAGIVGPVAFGAMHPALAGALRSAQPGEVLAPFSIAEWFLVARVDHHLPAQLDEPMRKRMIEELASEWLNNRIDESRKS